MDSRITSVTVEPMVFISSRWKCGKANCASLATSRVIIKRDVGRPKTQHLCRSHAHETLEFYEGQEKTPSAEPTGFPMEGEKLST